MGSEDDSQRRVAHKLQKKRPGSRPRLNIPDRFKDGEDAQEDVTAPRHTQHMNQSVFSMVAAAGSKVDFHSRFDDESSESEDETSPTAPPTGHGNGGLPAGKTSSAQQRPPVLGRPRKVTEHGLPALDVRTMKERKYMSQSFRKNSPEELSPKGGKTPRESPVMSQMLQARAAMNSSNVIAAGIQEHEQSDAHVEATDLSALSKQLMEIFDFEKPEDVISEYPCWLLQSVLLQGYMYITTKHICFYAYLPKKSNIVAKSGHLTKRGRQNPTYHRYWFTLKGDVLSYYQSASDLYFPSGNIDLRYGIQASQKGKDSKDFSVTTNQRIYWFKADSVASAKEWVKTLQKVIFRSHNEGDSVKISLPIENIIDIEDSPVLDFAETFKIRVFDSDETFAIDEYYFSFFSFGTDALNVLRSMIDDTPAQRLSIDLLRPTNQSPRSQGSRDNGQYFDAYKESSRGTTTPVLHDNVRATLSPIPSGPNSGRASPRLSCDLGGRASQELSRRSFDLSTLEPGRRSMSRSRKSSSKGRRDHRSPFLKPRGSIDSFDHSLDREHDSSAGVLSSNDTIASASQILDRSDVFKSPTIQETQPSSSRRPAVREGHPILDTPEDNQHFGATGTDFKILPPSRSQTRKLSTKHHGHTNLDGNSESGSNRGELQHSNSSPSLQNLVRVGAYPLQRAAGWAGLLTKRSKRMSSLLATESMGYIEKVSGMWQGGRKHYEDAAELHADDRLDDAEDDEDVLEHGARFRNHFALPESERLQATYFGHLHRVLPLYGKIYISNKSFCFRSLLPGTKTKMILPLKDIENVDKEKGFRWGYSGLVIVIKGHEELFFEYSAPDTRDDCAITLLQNIERVKYMKESGMLSREEKESVEAAKSEHKALQEARRKGHDEHELCLPKASETAGDTQGPPIMFDDPRASIINFKPTESLRITCLTIGSRGDVQPYIALCKGLLAEGHKPKIATHAEFEPWVRKHGIQFEPVFGDPAELMRICVENGMFTYSFLREASTKFRGWMDGLLTSAWKACQDTDILIESPSAMAGIHIAEALEIPFFRAFTMPWTRTRAYPHAFAVPTSKKGGAYNYLSYVMFDNVFWKAQAGQVNRWRKKELNLPSTSLDKLQPNKVPFMYNFSPSVVVPPIDYSDWIRVTGYWFLDEATNWEPPKNMVDFIKQARTDKKKIVYIGFGSITVSDPAALTKTIVDSVLKADVRCILSKGWSDRFEDKDAMKTEIPLPKEIHQIKSAPHDWLFKQVDAAAHHGGAGTTGASLRAGLPTIIKPFFGDQFFYGSRVEDLGVGICIKKLNVSVFSRALWEAVNDERIIVKAKVLGENIRSEDGVGNAIQSIYRDLEYAKSLIKKRGATADDGVEDSEESWTFIGDEGDAELVQRIADWSPMAQVGEDGIRVLGKKKSIRRTNPEMHV